MRLRPELTAREYGTVEALPAAARALLGGDFFAGDAWYRAVITAGLPAGARAVLLVLSGDAGTAALFAMTVSDKGTSALSTPYTCLWRPLLAPGLGPDMAAAVWRGFAAWCRRRTAVRLEALDGGEADAITAALAGTGLVKLRFDHFGNWHAPAVRDWPSYLAGRPGAVREAVRRRSRRLLAQGAHCQILRTSPEIDSGIAAYETVYAASWKTAEPFPEFNATLMRECAADGSLRLGLLSVAGAVLAAQIWVVRGDWAAVLKLAHDERARAQSPGTVLTAMMIEHLIERDGVRALDFGRGDDAYKADWTTERRQRVGILLVNPRTVIGLGLLVRHVAGRIREKQRLGGNVPFPPNSPSIIELPLHK